MHSCYCILQCLESFNCQINCHLFAITSPGLKVGLRGISISQSGIDSAWPFQFIDTLYQLIFVSLVHALLKFCFVLICVVINWLNVYKDKISLIPYTNIHSCHLVPLS